MALEAVDDAGGLSLVSYFDAHSDEVGGTSPEAMAAAFRAYWSGSLMVSWYDGSVRMYSAPAR